MSKEKKEATKSKRPKTHDTKLKANGSFMDIMQTIVKNAKSKDGKK